MLTLEDVIIRKKWLKASVVTLLIFPLFAFLFLVEYGSMTLQASLMLIIGGILLGGWGSFWICYFCAYRKIGTKYLTFILTTGPFSRLNGLITELKSNPTVWSLLFLAGELAIYIWWYRSTLQLRALNKRLKIEEVKQIEESAF